MYIDDLHKNVLDLNGIILNMEDNNKKLEMENNVLQKNGMKDFIDDYNKNENLIVKLN